MSLLSQDMSLCQTPHRRDVCRLKKSGWNVVPEVADDSLFDGVLIKIPRQHDEALHDMARALVVLRPGGLFLAAAANDEGGRRLRRDAAGFGIDCDETSKHHARIIIGVRPEKLNGNALEQAHKEGGWQQGQRHGLVTRPGLFAWDRIDEGSALLAVHLPVTEFTGRGADAGCGYGFLTDKIIRGGARPEALYCIDSDCRAVDACRRNFGSLPFVHPLWIDMADKEDDRPASLDWVVMNPPFHQGARAEDIALGQTLIAGAALMLRQGGSLWMVANRHLPYEEMLSVHFARVRPVIQDRGYKIYHAIR